MNDDDLRKLLDAVPVPPGLEERIRASVEKRRAFRYVAAAAAAFLIAAIAAFWPHPKPPAPFKPASSIAFTVSLREAAPEPLLLQETLLTADVSADERTLIFHFEGATK